MQDSNLPCFQLLLLLLAAPATSIRVVKSNGGGLQQHQLPSPVEYYPSDSLPVPVMIAGAGYPVETHRVTTADGYVLTLHRIPHGRSANGSEPGGRPVALLQHGILCSSADWVMGEPGKSLGYMMSDAGYDVWLGNFRGNIYSRDHVYANGTMDPNKKPFWDFSFHEMGVYDLPATIEYALGVSGRDSLVYMAHSMGTTALFVAAHYYPEWAERRVDLMVGLGPAAKLHHMRSPIKYAAQFQPIVEFILKEIGQHEFWTPSSIQSRISKFLCNEKDIRKWRRGRRRRRNGRRNNNSGATLEIDGQRLPLSCKIPMNVIFLIAGFSEGQMDKKLLPRILGHTPSGTSLKTLKHYSQIYKTHRFAAYDHGSPFSNLARHGSPRAPSYSLSRSRFPSALFWASNDWVSTPEDVAWLRRGLPRVVLDRRVPHPTFNHLDYLWGRDADRLVYHEAIWAAEEFKGGRRRRRLL